MGKLQKIEFWDEEANESVLFEIIDEIVIDGQRYLLVADVDEVATILKEIPTDDEEEDNRYVLVEDDFEFQKVSLSFMENDEYDVEI
jgi:hypothetical protein